MTTRSFTLIAAALGAVALAACGTGSAPGTGGAGGTGSTSSTSSTVSSSSSGTGGSSTFSSSSSGAGGSSANCTPTCADALANGGEPCSTDATATSDYSALSSCLMTNCATQCATFLSAHAALSATCNGCAETSCASQSQACANN